MVRRPTGIGVANGDERCSDQGDHQANPAEGRPLQPFPAEHEGAGDDQDRARDDRDVNRLVQQQERRHRRDEGSSGDEHGRASRARELDRKRKEQSGHARGNETREHERPDLREDLPVGSGRDQRKRQRHDEADRRGHERAGGRIGDALEADAHGHGHRTETCGCDEAEQNRDQGENRIVKRNSPSRLRFRPPLRPTFRFRVLPPGLASSYSRSVLGAIGTLGPSPEVVKRASGE